MPKNQFCHLVCHMSHPWLFLSRAFLHEHFPLLHLPILPHNENTQYIPHISNLTQSKSGAIKIHSGVKTCRVAEPRAQQLPQVMSPKSLRPSQESKLILEIHVNYMMLRKILGKKITEEVKEFGEIRTAGAPDSEKNQRRPTSNRRCISIIPWKPLQILTSKMESYKKC